MTTFPHRFIPPLAAFSALVGLSILPGCSSLSRTTAAADISAVAIPTRWQGPAVVGSAAANPKTAVPTAVVDLATWWHQLNDPTLTALIDQALTTSPDLLTARSRIAVARAQRSITGASLLPSLSAYAAGSGGETRQHDTATTTRSETYSAGLSANLEIDVFGSARAATSAATADWEQAIDTFYAAQVSLSAEIATTYLNLRATEARLDLNDRTQESRRTSLQFIEWRHNAGLDDTLALTQAQTSLAQVAASIPSLQQSVALYRNQLTVLCGLPPGELDGLVVTSIVLPSSSVVPTVGIPAETLAQRPDVSAAARAVEAAAARLTSAERDRLPSLNLSGSLNVAAAHAADLFNPVTTAATLLGSLTAPLFDGGRIRQNIRIQDELTQQALLTYQSTVVSALAEVENALVARDRTQARVAALLDAQTSATTTRDLAQQRYAAGQIDYLQVLDADRTLLSINDSVLTAQADETAALIQLYRAVGGGWTPLPATSVASL